MKAFVGKQSLLSKATALNNTASRVAKTLLVQSQSARSYMTLQRQARQMSANQYFIVSLPHLYPLTKMNL